MANAGIMHWKVGERRVACNTRRAIMYLPFDEFMAYPWKCKRCLAKANAGKALEAKRAKAGIGQ